MVIIRFIYGDVGVDILAADKTVEEEIQQACHNEPVACHVACFFCDELLYEGKHATAYNHHHEDTRCLCGVFAETFDRKVEDTAPHYRSAETADHEQVGTYGNHGNLAVDAAVDKFRHRHCGCLGDKDGKDYKDGGNS